MPYFSWRGVDLMGTIKTGTVMARSAEHVDEILFKRTIALIKCRTVKRRSWLRPIRLSHIVQLFRELSVLVSAGVLLPEALDIVAHHLDHPKLQEITHRIANSVHEGISLSAALRQYPYIFNACMVQLIAAGEQSGSLAQALDALSTYLDSEQDFYARLRTALMLPVLTLGFFMLIASIIVVVIVPRFAEIFTSMQKDIPELTAMLLSISAFIASFRIFFVLGGIMVIMGGMWLYRKTANGKYFFDHFVLRIPFIGMLIKQRFIAYIMRSLALLLKGGEQLVAALQLVEHSIDNTVLRAYVTRITHEVESGVTLSDAMRDIDSLFSHDVIAMIYIGQESGTLPRMLEKIANAYHTKVHRSLTFITVLVQPLFMIILGLLVMLLIFAVYIPIFNLSNM